MRLFLFFCTIILASCSGQQTKVEQSKIDTAKLFDPRPDKIEVNFVPFDVYKNCIAIKEGFFVIVINQIQNRFDTESELANYIKSHSDEIKNKIYVLYDSSINFRQIVTVLDLLKNNKVDNYRVIDMDTFFKVPPPTTVQPPTSVSNTYNKDDSQNLVITISKNGYNVSHHNKSYDFIRTYNLDNYILVNKKQIDSSKIFVASDANLPYSRFKAVKDVLKKHKFFLFKIIINKQDE